MKNYLTDELIHKIREVSGLRITEFDHAKLETWLASHVSEIGLKSPMDYLRYLNSNIDLSEDRKKLSDLLTTGETFFMRDPEQMALIKRVIIPELLVKNQQKKHIRLWSPACSTGEEVYSIIILLEQMISNFNDWTVDVIGSDINSNYIAQAKKAVYRDWSFRGCNQEFKDTYFKETADGWKLIDRIRDRARFLELDLVGTTLPDVTNNLYDVDFILCRNLFIYMNFESISVITDKLSACLVPNGILMTAHGELHAYRKSGLRIKIYPESLVYEKHLEIDEKQSINQLAFTSQPNKLEDKVLALKKKTPKAPICAEETFDSLMESAWLLADKGSFDQALKIYTALIHDSPMQAELHFLHAIISIEMGNLIEAKDDLRKTLYLDASFIPAYLELITLNIRAGNIKMAIKHCDQVLKSIETAPLQTLKHVLYSSTKADIKVYLKNLQNSLTSQLDSSKLSYEFD